jgi:hypothetical protein
VKAAMLDFYSSRTVFLVAVSVRLVCAFVLLPAMPGTFSHVHPDTPTYFNAFLNLLENGRYCFDLEIRDSCFYRMPTYPFFLGLNYLAVGDGMSATVSVMQAMLDALTCCIAVAIGRQLSLSIWALRYVAAFFVFNPFTLFWIPVQMPEVIGVFLVVGAVYLCVRHRTGARNVVLAAGATVLALWTKQYIAAILPPMVFFLLARRREDRPRATLSLFFAAFLILYSPWVIRNYIHYGEPILVSGKTTGARHFLADYAAAMDFYSLFHVNFNKQIREVIYTGATTLPHSDFVDRNKAAIEAAGALAHRCGPSFRTWRGETVKMDSTAVACENDVAAAFRELTGLARKQMPVLEFYRTSVLGFVKALTKYDLDFSQRSSFIQAPLFVLRFVLLILAFASVFLASSREQRMFAFGANLFWLSTAAVLSFVFRHVEMRYLLMADTLMFISAAITISWLQNRRRTSPRVPERSPSTASLVKFST